MLNNFRKSINAFFAIICMLPTFAYSQTETSGCGTSIKSGVSVQIVYINGIMNQKSDACASSDALIQMLASNGLDKSKVNWSYIHNPQDWGGIGDVNELRSQAYLSELAKKQSDGGGSRKLYFEKLGGIYKNLFNNASYVIFPPEINDVHRIIETTKSIYNGIVARVTEDKQSLVIVPHSQGNFYVEAVYGILYAEGRTDILDKIRVVGVATISIRSPNDNYVTLEQDQALFKLQSINTFLATSYSPATPLYKGCDKDVYDSELLFYPEAWAVSQCSPEGVLKALTPLVHEFVDIYLNNKIIDVYRTPHESIPSIISNKIKTQLSQLTSSSAVDVPGTLFYSNFTATADLTGWQFTLPWNSTYKTTDYSLRDGYLELRMDQTDKGGWALSSSFPSADKIKVSVNHYMDGGAYFFPSIMLTNDGAAPENIVPGVAFNNIQVGFVRSHYGPDYACSAYDIPRVIDNLGCVTSSKTSSTSSSSLFKRWINTVIVYDSISGELTVDYENDGVIDFIGSISAANRFKVTRLAFGTFGWHTGHMHRIDSFKVESIN